MLNIKETIAVTAFSQETPDGFIGCVEAVDASWRVYIGTDGYPVALHVVKSRDGELLPTAIRADLKPITRDQAGLSTEDAAHV